MEAFKELKQFLKQVKILGIFFTGLLVLFPLYAELTRDEVVSYTLDYYAKETKDSIPKVSAQTDSQDEKKDKASTQTELKAKIKEFLAEEADSQQKSIKSKPIEPDTRKAEIVEQTLNNEKELQKKQKKVKIEKDEKTKKPTKAPSIKDKKTKKYGSPISFNAASEETTESQKGKPVAKSVDGKAADKKNIDTAKNFSSEKDGSIKDILKNVHPYLTAVEEYTDNLFHFRSDKIIDCITKLYPGLIFTNKKPEDTKKPEIYLNAGMQSLLYARESQFNDQSPYGTGYFKFGLGKTEFYTYASAKKNRGTPSDIADFDAETFIDSWAYEYGQDFSLKLNKFDVQLQYNHAETAYIGDQLKSSNHMRDTLAMRDSFNISSKTKVFVEYAHGWMNYYKNHADDWDYDKYYIGLKGKISPKINGLMRFGYIFTKMKDRKDINGRSVDINLNYKASPRLNYNLQFVNTIGDMNLLSSSATKARGISLGVNYLPPHLKKLRLNTNVSYWIRGNDRESRDNYFNVYIGPQYNLKKWLRIGLQYGFARRTSKAPSHYYINNTVNLTVSSEF